MSWPLVKLKEVAQLINGRAYKKHEMLSEGKYLLMRVGNFFSNRSWYYSDLELPARQYCDKGDLLYAWSASFGPRIWDGDKVIYHYHIWKLVLNEALIDKKYLYHALKNDVERIKQEQGSGSTMVHITKTAMEEREIPLPPLAEQKRIAAILDKADVIRRKRQQAIKLADDFLRSVFLDMFGDPQSPNAETVSLKDIAELEMGQSPNGSSYNENGQGEPLINGPVEFGKKYPKERQWTTEPKKYSREGDILFCVRGATAGKMNLSDKSYCIGRGVAAIRAKDKNYTSFLFRTLHLSYDYFQRTGVGSTFINISKDNLLEFEFPKTDLIKLEKFEVLAAISDSVKEKHEAHYALAVQQFNSLSQKAFASEL